MPQPHVTILLDSDGDELEYTDDESSSSEDGNHANTPEPAEVQPESLTVLTPPPATIPQKRKRGPKPKSLLHFQATICAFPSLILSLLCHIGAQLVEPEPTPTKTLTYILTITPESEVTKPSSKRTLKSATLQLKSDEPWSTLEAQLLAKISALLKPKRLNYEDYQVYFYIPRSIPKPGMILSNEDDYAILLQRATTLKRPDPTINIDITEQGADKAEKENAGPEADDGGQPKKKKKQVCTQLELCYWFLALVTQVWYRILLLFPGMSQRTNTYRNCENGGYAKNEHRHVLVPTAMWTLTTKNIWH